MKLRNKKTGQLGNFIINKDHFECVDLDYVPEYSNLAELNAEWEDYEEPEEFWYINECGDVLKYKYDGGCSCPILEAKEIGNYFGTKEEAEKAVEKLKAFTRLKDKGLRFNSWTIPEEPKTPHIKLVIEAEMDVPDSPYDLDLLFSQEDK